MKFPTLYHKAKTGAIHQWTIWTEGADIVTEYGQVGGQMQYARRTAEGKNIGRSNETSPAEQAVCEAKSDWTYRVERKYAETMEAAQEEVFLPMLAKTFKDQKKPQSKWGRGVTYPCDVQPKLDGVRCMAFWDGNEIYLGTRNGKEWTAPRHIKRELEEYMPKEMVLDGELYIHGALFEDLSSWTKKVYPETAKLEYHVFDMPLDENGINRPWRERCKNMERFFKKFSNEIKMLRQVPIYTAKNMTEALAYEDQFIADGYEGAMTRNLDDEYLFGHRATGLQKIKSSIDAEFQVVSFKEGVGRDKGCVVWICRTKDGQEFDCRPKGTLERRAQIYNEAKRNFKKFDRQWLKVRYQNLTENGIPRFPRSVGFRDERDM